MFTPTDIEQANNLFVRLLKGELDMREEIETVPKNVRAAFEEMIHLAHETAQSLSSTPDSSDESRFEVVTKHLMCALMKARMEPETVDQTLRVLAIESLMTLTVELHKPPPMLKDALTLEEVEYRLEQFELVDQLIRILGSASEEFKEDVKQWKNLLWMGKELPQTAQLLLKPGVSREEQMKFILMAGY